MNAHRPNHIVFTTIFRPTVLAALVENLRAFNELESTTVWVIGDRKTPTEAVVMCQSATDAGLQTNYVDIPSQDEWGKRCPEFYSRIPYNNETRRNLGYLMALQAGCQRLISIDDDNYPTADNFIAGHELTGKTWESPVVSEPAKYHNVCEHLRFDVARAVYPRGFPFRLRGSKNTAEQLNSPQPCKVGVTAGLWLNEPDVDATTWLNGRILSKEYTGPDAFVLHQNTWSPINTQNTSVARELIPAFLCVPMGWDVPGGKIQRYGDIWGGYFLQALIQGLPHHVAFGRPLVDHRRNPHDYVDDLRQEFWGMILTDWLVDRLRSDFKPSGTDVCDRVVQLAEFLESSELHLPAWTAREMHEFIVHTGGTLRHWSKACRTLGL